MSTSLAKGFRTNRALGNVARLSYGVSKSLVDTIRNRRLTTTWWSVRDARWHYRWPEGRVSDEGRWKDAQGWATYGFYYGMDDLLWRHYRPKAGDTVLDIGAGHGGETLYLANMVGPTGTVLAVEAAPGPFERLRDLKELNNWPQVLLSQVAIGAESGVATMSSETAWIAGNIFEGGEIPVPVVTIDELCEKHGIKDVAWVKMNIEGAERDALRGMEAMAPNIRSVTISCHDFLGTEWGRSLEFVIEWLKSHDFQVIKRLEGDFVQQLYVYGWR